MEAARAFIPLQPWWWKETPSPCVSLAPSRTGALGSLSSTVDDPFPISLMGTHNVPSEKEVRNYYQQNTLFLRLQCTSVFGFPREMLAEEDLLQFLLSCHSAKHGRESQLSGKVELVLFWVFLDCILSVEYSFWHNRPEFTHSIYPEEICGILTQQLSFSTRNCPSSYFESLKHFAFALSL